MSAIRTPPANDAYRDNFDGIFGRRGDGSKAEEHTSLDGTRTITITPAQYIAGWNDAITQVLELLSTNHVHVDAPAMKAILAARK